MILDPPAAPVAILNSPFGGPQQWKRKSTTAAAFRGRGSWGRGDEPESVRGSRSCEGDEGEKNAENAEKWVMYSTGEVHLVVQGDTIWSHDRWAPVRVDSYIQMTNARHGSFDDTGKIAYLW